MGKASLLSSHHRGPDPLPDDAYSALIAPKCLVCPTAPNSALSVQVTVTDLSDRPWPQEGISLSARFVRVSDGTELSGFDNRFPIGTDFAPHESKQYVIKLTAPAQPGDYRLEVDLVQELITWFSNKGTKRGELAIRVETVATKATTPSAGQIPGRLPDDAYSALIAPRCLACPTAPGSALNVLVNVTDLSDHPWPRKDISLSARFVRISDGTALSGFDNRFPIGTDFAPHESKQYVIKLTAPAQPGDYRLEVDLVHEMITWFSNKGTKRGELSLRVVPVEAKALAPSAQEICGGAEFSGFYSPERLRQMVLQPGG